MYQSSAINRRSPMTRIVRASATIIIATLANSALAQPGLTVRDVGVYQVSAYGQQLNARTLFRSTLPPTMLSQRPPAPRDQAPQPMPIGLITFEGAPNDDIDVMLEFTSGRFVANWPPAARRSQRLLWAKLKVNADPTDSPRITPGHWLSRLRDMPRLYAHAEGHANRGLLYDAEIGHQPQLKVTFKDNQYSVENSGPYMVHDFTLYVPVADGKGWKVSAAKEAPGADKPPEQPKPEGAANPESVFDPAQPAPAADGAKPAQPAAPAAAPAAEPAAEDAPAAAAPAAAAAPPAAVGAVVVEGGAVVANPVSTPAAAANPQPGAPAAAAKVTPLADVVTQPVPVATALESWNAKLAEQGLADPEIEHVLSILSTCALRPQAATAIYRLDALSLEKLLPLEITPIPEKTVRVGLVILIDCDPQFEASITELIKQLGDPSWKNRVAAQAKLKAVSQAAIPKLTEAVNNPDVEISYRAEQLLEELQSEPKR